MPSDSALPLVTTTKVLFPGAVVVVPNEGENALALGAAQVQFSQVVVGAPNDAVATLAALTFAPDGSALLCGVRRVRITTVESRVPFVSVLFEAFDETVLDDDLTPNAKELLSRFRAAGGPERRDQALWLEQLAIPDDVVNFVAANSGFSLGEQLRLLALPNAEARAAELLTVFSPVSRDRVPTWAWVALLVVLALGLAWAVSR